jgi:hypothetical protein
MTRSLATSPDVRCPRCHHPMRPTSWIVVDFAEHPELLDAALQGSLQVVVCPACGARSWLNTMLMLHAPDAWPPVLFSPADGSTDDQIRDQQERLLAHLGRDGGVDVDELPLGGPSWMLPMLLRHALSGRVAKDLVSCTLDEPSAREWQMYELCIRDFRSRRIRQVMRAIISPVPMRESFLDARRLVLDRPELSSADALTLLSGLAGEARTEGEIMASRMIGELRDLLARARQVGVDAAFDEYARQVATGQAGALAWTDGPRR